MTDPLPRDELASAYLDGEATPAERATVDADAGLLARVDELRAVRRMVAAPVPARPAADVDATISAALAGDRPEPAPVPLRSPARRVRRHRIGLAVLGAAAAVVTVVAVAVNRTSDGSSPSAGRALTVDSASSAAASGAPETTAAAATTTPERQGAGTSIAAATATTAAATTSGAATTSAASTTVAPRPAVADAGSTIGLPALGAVDDAAGLRAALGAVAPPGATTASTPDAPCTVPDARLAATVVWRGTVAFVFVDEAGAADIVSQSGCAALATVPLS
jgi:hypothetical protein